MKVVSVRSQGVESVCLQYDDGVSVIVDLTPYLVGPIFDQIRTDARFFSEVRVDPLFGSIFWPNGADIAPETLIAFRRVNARQT